MQAEVSRLRPPQSAGALKAGAPGVDEEEKETIHTRAEYKEYGQGVYLGGRCKATTQPRGEGTGRLPCV